MQGARLWLPLLVLDSHFSQHSIERLMQADVTRLVYSSNLFCAKMRSNLMAQEGVVLLMLSCLRLMQAGWMQAGCMKKEWHNKPSS